jgi:hypothetical protein
MGRVVHQWSGEFMRSLSFSVCTYMHAERKRERQGWQKPQRHSINNPARRVPEKEAFSAIQSLWAREYNNCNV